jgi:hypothetical protein
MRIGIGFLIFLLSSCSFLNYKKRNNLGLNLRNKAPEAGAYNPVKKKIALLTFFNDTPYGGEDLAITATEEFRREVSRTKDFIVDSVAEKIFGSSKEIFAGGGIKLVQLARKAKLAGINLVVYGRLSKAKVRQKTDEIGVVRKTKSFAQVAFELHVFDVNSNKEIFIDTTKANVDDGAFRFYLSKREDNLLYRRKLLRYSAKVAVRKMIPRLVELGAKLDWVGRVAKIIGNKVYINAGRQSGVSIGDILKVITEGHEIFDPETGALIGVSKGQVKGTLEVVDFFGPDGSVSVLHSGGSVTEGDFVELY